MPCIPKTFLQLPLDLLIHYLVTKGTNGCYCSSRKEAEDIHYNVARAATTLQPQVGAHNNLDYSGKCDRQVVSQSSRTVFISFSASYPSASRINDPPQTPPFLRTQNRATTMYHLLLSCALHVIVDNSNPKSASLKVLTTRKKHTERGQLTVCRRVHRVSCWIIRTLLFWNGVSCLNSCASIKLL